MADVWIGRKRWTCTYCQVTINDDVPSRQHHESGMRHKNNVERALRGLYKDTAAQRREAERHAREIAEIEYAAGRAHRKQDGAADAGVPGASGAPAAPKAWAPSDKMATYTTARALGVGDEDEQAWQAQFARRKAAARVGAWETVTEAAAAPATDAAAEPVRPASNEGAASAPLPVDAAPLRTEREQARSFALRERTLGAGDDDDDDDALPEIVVKRRRTDAGEGGVGVKAERAEAFGGGVKEEPHEAPVKEELQEVPVKEEPREAPVKEEPTEALVKQEPTETPVKQEPTEAAAAPSASGAKDTPVKQEPTIDAGAPAEAPDGSTPASPPGDALFRKRKPRGGAAKKVASRAFT